MKQELTISVPTQWKDLTLQTYLKFQKDLDLHKDNEDAILDLMIHHFCGINLDNIKGISINSYNDIREKFNKFEKPESLPLQKFINIGGTEYGFEPNLSKMAYGAYVDISQYEQLTIDKNWPKIMNILYRPVTKKTGELYQIEPYTGKDDWIKWLDVDMSVHFGSLFFFINLWKDLLHAILNSLKETDLPPNIKSILVKNGKGIAQSLSLQEEIYKKWKR